MIYLNVNTKSLCVVGEGGEIREVKLSEIETSVLAVLTNNVNSCSRNLLLEKCWVDKVVTEQSVNVTISSLRNKAKIIGEEDLIATIREHGYKLSKIINVDDNRFFKLKMATLKPIRHILSAVKKSPGYLIMGMISTYFMFVIFKFYWWTYSL